LSLLALLLLPVVCSCASVVVRASPPPISFLSVPCCCIPVGEGRGGEGKEKKGGGHVKGGGSVR
jgi:hypothetical protein